MNKNIITILGLLAIGFIIVSAFKKPSSTLVLRAPIVEFQGKLDTITALSQMKSDSAIWKHNGKYTLIRRVDSDDDDPAPKLESAEGTCSQLFGGKARSAAKLSFAAAPYQIYRTMADMKATLKPDSFMIHSAGLTSNSLRIAFEKRNVSFNAVFLYGIAREGDDDFHLIVGDKNGKNYFNCEISGLPPSSSSAYTTLKTTRDYIVTHFGSDFCGSKGYTLFKPALPITIKGSLFYDIDHTPGTVGPAGFRPPTSWEIHPINAIHF